MKHMEKHADAEQLDTPEDEDVRVAARRMQAYSPAAIALATQVDRVFVNHEGFKVGLHAFDRIFQLAPLTAMPHGLRLIGPPGSGKTTLFTYHRDSLPRSSLFVAGLGAVGVRAGSRPTAGQLVGALLHAYRYPFKYGNRGVVYARRDILFDLIKQKGTRYVFVDEAHRLLNQLRRIDGQDQEPEATVFLRDMMDECRVGLVLAGTVLLDRLEGIDLHLADRVVGRHELRYFATPGAEWHGLLMAFAKECSEFFDLGYVLEPVEARRLHAATGGNLRRVKRLLTEAVLVAVDRGQRTPDAAVLDLAFRAIHGSDGAAVNPYGH